MRHINARVTRWFLALQEFNFVVEQRLGKQHQNADALSGVHCKVFHIASDTLASRQRGVGEGHVQNTGNLSWVAGTIPSI